jgi:hypothetical protein
MDSAMINMQCGNIKEANRYFHDAEDLSKSLWTKSISQGAASMLTNDMIIAYPGEDFEKALINLFSSFSYIKLNEFNAALTECRRLDLLLTELNEKYDKKNIYKEDALGRYISGILSEADGEYSEAYIYYYEALRAYKNYNNDYGTPTPKFLLEDMLRVSHRADKTEEAKRLIPSHNSIKYTMPKDAVQSGKVVFIHFNGKAPVKIEKKFTVNTNTGPISIAFPEYRSTPPYCKVSKVLLNSNSQNYEMKAVLAEDINKIAVKNLSDRKARIWAKTIARAVAKKAVVDAAAKQTKKELGSGWGLVAQIAGNIAADATESADIRCWRTLPGEIYISRLFVQPGDYKVSAEQCNGIKTNVDTISIKSGETKFVFFDTVY